MNGDYIGEPSILLKYNLKNKLINESIINHILNKYGVTHSIHDIKLFQIAMTHKSYCV